jgi:deoxycytidylate deaminase
MSDFLEVAASPELVFGLVAPIGVDLDLITTVLTQALEEVRYKVVPIKLTSLMGDVQTGLDLSATTYIAHFRQRIAYANQVRVLLGDEALAVMAISAIRAYRLQAREDEQSDNFSSSLPRNEEAPLPGRAYIIRQFKRPEEIALLRSVYGRQFIVVSAYVPQEARIRRIAERERESRGGIISAVDAHNEAYKLVFQDAKETLDDHGQALRDAFPLGDVFIDAISRKSCEITLRRFVHLLFGNNEITPTRDEYGMYMAKSASLRSSDLSRQVGAAVFRPSGEIATLGCNEVPKAGGGTYWTDDPQDTRDFVQGYDPNEKAKIEVLVDIVHRLKEKGHLSEDMVKVGDANEIMRFLLLDNTDDSVKESRVMDLLEFGRIIHAEMSAICDASREGIPIKGSTLFCTTFPCHICAKHIVAAGIQRVVYLEPYPKSYASELHPDSIEVDPPQVSRCSTKTTFMAFIGVSPFRYRDLFEKGKRKYSGLAQRWNKGVVRPMIEVYYPSYFEAETFAVGIMREKLDSLGTHSP